MTPAMCLDPAKAQKKPNPTPNSLQNHEQRRASAGKSCVGRYTISYTRFLQRILNWARPHFGTQLLNFAQVKPVISPAKMERRRKHVAVAIADSRIEGYSRRYKRSS
jgi:hypothetical protein